jgi:hypothetical protein
MLNICKSDWKTFQCVQTEEQGDCFLLNVLITIYPETSGATKVWCQSWNTALVSVHQFPE